MNPSPSAASRPSRAVRQRRGGKEERRENGEVGKGRGGKTLPSHTTLGCHRSVIRNPA